MFTINQIMAARAKIRTVDDFAIFLREMMELGVTGFESFPADGHSEYFGDNGFHLATKQAYSPLPVGEMVNKKKFEADLTAYLAGEISYPDFCEQCTAAGIKKWKADFKIMTCVYLDVNDEVVYIQSIP